MKNKKILLADDDEDDRLFFRHALADSGIEPDLTTVSDGSKLLDYMLRLSEAPTPDVIFLDINMPGMDGKSCLREIRRQENKYLEKTLFYQDKVTSMTDFFADDWQSRLFNSSPKTFSLIK